MILTTENTTAENGTSVHSHVSIDIDEVGIRERPFRMQAGAGGDYLASSFHKTRNDAEKDRKKMHAAYMEVHAN
jgi:hypothetical protein